MMKIQKCCLVLLVVLLTFQSKGQSLDSLKSRSVFNKSIIPVSLISLGLIVNKSNFEISFQKDIRNKVGDNYENRIDNFILFAPIAEMYVADILGVKSKNHWFDQSKNLFISNVLASLITNRLKVITHKTRPSGDEHSFPSGHTTIAFTNAAVLFNEFKDTSPILAYSGYAFATATGGFRIANNKHWISDVMVGAGIGMLVTQLVYYFEPLKSFNPFKEVENVSFVPQFNEGTYGFSFAYQF